MLTVIFHIRGGKFEEIRKMLDVIKECGVTDAALLALPYHSVSENISVLYWKMNYTKIKLAAFGGLHSTDKYADIPYEKQVEKLLDLGCDGIKLLEMLPRLYVFSFYEKSGYVERFFHKVSGSHLIRHGFKHLHGF